MSLLDKIRTGTIAAPRKLMVHGGEGDGKSTFASKADKVIFLPTEEGLNDIDCMSFPIATSYELVMESISDIYVGKKDKKSLASDRKYLAIDTVDGVATCVDDRVAKDYNVDSVDKIPYGKGHLYALKYWREILEGLNAIRELGVGVILIAHSQISKFESPDMDTYDRYSPRLNKHINALLCDWCDEIFFATQRTHTKTIEEGFNRKRIQGISNGERILITTKQPAYVAKNRLDMPAEIPMEWSEYAKYFKK